MNCSVLELETNACKLVKVYIMTTRRRKSNKRATHCKHGSGYRMADANFAGEDQLSASMKSSTGSAFNTSVVLSHDLFPKVTEDEWNDYTRYWEERVVRNIDACKPPHRILEKYVSIYDRKAWNTPFVAEHTAAELQRKDEEIRHVLSHVFEASVTSSCASAAEALYAIEKPIQEGGCSTIVMSIERIQDKNMIADHILWKRRNPGGIDSMVLHGTDVKSANNICDIGFRARLNRTGRSLLGRGNYTTNSAKVALVYAKPDGPFDEPSGASGASGASASAAKDAPSFSLKNRTGMYTKYQQHLVLARMAHGPVEVVGVKDAMMMRNEKGKLATLYTNNPDSRNFHVFCAPDDAQLVVQYQVIVVLKLHEMSHWERLPIELWVFQFRRLLVMRWLLNELTKTILGQISQNQSEDAISKIKTRLHACTRDWDALRPVLEDMVREQSVCEQAKLKMPNGDLVSLDKAWRSIVEFFNPLAERASWIRSDSKLVFKNLSRGDARFENVGCTVNVELPTDQKELDTLNEMLKLRSADLFAASGFTKSTATSLADKSANAMDKSSGSGGQVAQQITNTVATTNTSSKAREPFMLIESHDLRLGYEVLIDNTWKGFERFRGLKGWIVGIWCHGSRNAVDFLVRFEAVSSDETLRDILLKKPNQKGISYQDKEQNNLGEPLLRCKIGNFSKFAFPQILTDATFSRCMRFTRLPSYFGVEVNEQVVIKESWSGLSSLVGKSGKIVEIRFIIHTDEFGQAPDHDQSVFALVLLDEDTEANNKLLKDNALNNLPSKPLCTCFSWKNDQEQKMGRPLLLCAWAHIARYNTTAVNATLESSVVATLAGLSKRATDLKRPAGGQADDSIAKRLKK